MAKERSPRWQQNFSRVLKLSLAVVFFAFPFSSPHANGAARPKQDSFEHLPEANLIVYDREKGLQVLTIPPTDAMDPLIEVRRVGDKPVGCGDPMGIYGGHIICRAGQSLFAIDLHDGTIRTLTPAKIVTAAFSNGHLYYLSKLKEKTKEFSHELFHIDLESLKQTSVCRIARQTASMGGPTYSIFVAPNGLTAAVTEFQRSEFRSSPFASRSMARVVFAKPGQATTVKSQYRFPPITISNGAGIYDRAPKFSWLDNGTLLFASHATGTHPGDFGPQVIPPGGEPMRIEAIDSSNGSHKIVCELPKLSSPVFVDIDTTQDGIATVDFLRKGLHKVDIAAKTFKKAKSIGTGIHFKNHDQSPKLPLDSNIAGELARNGFLRVHPSENRVAWFNENAAFSGFGSLENDKLHIYDPVRGKQMAYEGVIGTTSDAYERAPVFAWATDAEMAFAEHLRSLSTYEPKPRKPAK